jgi:UDP-2,3-diacylglucosamine pyrophosphatase LpxH
MQKTNIVNIVEFLYKNQGYLKWGKSKLAELLGETVEDIKSAKSLIKNQGFFEVLSNFKPDDTSYTAEAKLFNYSSDFTVKMPINNNTLFISDLHCPMEHPKALDFCKMLYTKYSISQVIFVGDMLDFYGLSVYEKSTNYKGIKDEISVAKEVLKDWYKAFPNAIVLHGNHVERLERKLGLSGIPSNWIKPLEELLEVPTWKFVHSYETDKFIVIHGTGNKNTTKTILAKNKSVVLGHHHSCSSINYVSNNIWTMQLGALIDLYSYAFNYTKEQAIPAINSCGVLYNGTPIIEILK